MGSCLSLCDSVSNNEPGHDGVVCFTPEAAATDPTVTCTAEAFETRREESDAATNELIAMPDSQMINGRAKPLFNNVQIDARSHVSSDRTSSPLPISHAETGGQSESVAAAKEEKEPRLKIDEAVLCFKPQAAATELSISCTAEVLELKRDESEAATNELIATPTSEMINGQANPLFTNVQTGARSRGSCDRTSNAVTVSISHVEKDRKSESVAPAKEEKEPRLKTDEMRLIFLRLPTSALVKFISSKTSPLGKYWFAAAQAVIETRLPFAISVEPRPALLDCNRDRIGWVKRYKGLLLSSLCHLIEEASFYAYVDGEFLFIEVGYLLSSLPNLRNLKIHIQRKRPYDYEHTKLALTRDGLANQSLVALDQLRSASVLANADDVSQADCTKLSQLIACMTNVSQLHLSCNILHAASCCVPEAAAIIANVAELEYQCHDRRCTAPNERGNAEFIARRCSQLRKLRVIGGRPGDILPLFPAIRDLANLATLGLRSWHFGFTGQTNLGNVTSVTQLNLFEHSFDVKKLMAFVSKFPNIEQLLLICEHDAAVLLSSLGRLLASGIIARLQKLTLAATSLCNQRTELKGEDLVALLGRANLPKMLDLSDIAIVRTPLCQDFLTRLFNVMRENNAEYLSLRAYVTPSDLASFKRVLPAGGKVVVWRAKLQKEDYYMRACFYTWEDSSTEFANYKITGVGLNSKPFTIRLFSEVKHETFLFQFYK